MKLSPYVLVAVVLSIPGPSSAYPVDRDSVEKRQQDLAVEFPTVDLDRRGLFSWILNLVDDDSLAAAAPAPAATTVAAQVAPAPVASVAPVAAPATTSASSGGFGKFLSGLFGGSSSTTTASTAPAAAPTASSVASPAAAAAPAAKASSSSGGILGFFSNLFGESSSSTSTTPTASAPVVASSVASSVAVSSVQVPAAVASASAAASAVLGTSTAGSTVSGAYTNLPGFDSDPSSSPTEASYTGSRIANVKAASSAKGISYSPYTKSGACKTAAEVKSDIAELSPFSIIRLYSVDCSGIQNVLAAMSSSQKLFLGVWPIDLSSVQSDLQSAKQQVQTSSRGWSAVHTIAIGNEQVNSGQGTVQQESTGVETARTCDVSDYLAVNSHPYWDGGVQPSNSGPWLQNQISNLKNACGNSKSILITETGWPTEGSNYGQCQPSVSNQLAAIKSINSVLADQVFMFTTFNDYWKDGGAYGVEKYWGIYGDPNA